MGQVLHSALQELADLRKNVLMRDLKNERIEGVKYKYLTILGFKFQLSTKKNKGGK